MQYRGHADTNADFNGNVNRISSKTNRYPYWLGNVGDRFSHDANI